MKRKWMLSIVLVIVMGALLALAGCGSSDEQTSGDEGEEKIAFPERKMDIIVEAGAGGGSDTFARAVGQELSDIFNVPVNIINMPGANGGVALQEMLNRPADGYTIKTLVSTHQTEIALGKIEDPAAFEALALLHEDTYALHVKEGGKYSDIDALIADAKANPGQIKIAGTYSLALDEIVVRKFEKAAGIELNYVPYSETGKMQADLLGGHVDVMIDEFPPTLALIDGGKVKTLMVFAKERIAEMPDIPTSVEKGCDVTDGQLRGFLINAETPQEIKDILEDALKEAYETERYQQYVKDSYLHLKKAFLGSDEYNELITKQAGEYKVILDELTK